MPTNFPQIIFSWGLLLAVIIKIHAAIEIASDEQWVVIDKNLLAQHSDC
jgi:hypothetical protein